MTGASDSAHVRIMLADYAVADASNKITSVGGGLSLIGLNPDTGTTAPFTVIVIVSFSPRQLGESPAIELSLETADDRLVTLPGQPGPLRVATAEKLTAPAFPGIIIPNDAVRPKNQILMQFQNGLPLAAGMGYRWRVRVDQDTRPEWTEGFYIPTASPGPVFH